MDSVNAKAGTVGGTLLVVLLNISAGEVLKTVVLATIGAVVSFFVSWGLKRLMKYHRRDDEVLPE